ncbi:MAG: GntR family transcriptional regulator [Alphaproteobacteria bacterium]|jgi:DNA-binding GntR family transcriptional regulator|nr:GntR family transcriptional regulator [Alphaproteobacteria bacterium]MDH5557119.1 GntR family transcriptional regulator [Alphaproteobacteria bacterium]
MSSQLTIPTLQANVSLKEKTYDILKEAICRMNIYAPDAQLRLDERQLSEQLGISRTPLREALVRLEQEGLVNIIPRRGIFIVRKTKREIVELIIVWAALEGMAARLATQNASAEDIASLRKMFPAFSTGDQPANIDEYSERNIEFHQTILRLGGCGLLVDMADQLFLHVRSIRTQTIGEADRATRSVKDHRQIIEAIEARDTDLAERLVREHALDLAAHIDKNVSYLD